MIMADEKTGNDASNNPQNGIPTGAPEQSAAPVVIPPKPPVGNIMPPAPEMKIPLNVPARQNFADLVASTKLKEIPKPPAPSAPSAAATTPAATPTPPVAPMPPVVPPPTPPSAPTPLQAPVAPPVLQASAPAAPLASIRDTTAEDVGLVRPAAKIPAPPDPMRDEMSKILASVKLTEKREVKGSVPKPQPVAPVMDEKTLNDVLTARITETNVTPAAVPPPATTPNTAETSPTTLSNVPDQEMFHEALEISPLHTLKQDLQEVVREQKMSVVRAVALEQEKKRPEQFDAVVKKAPSRAPTILAIVGLLLLLGLGALGGVYYVASVQNAPTAPVENDSIVFAEQTVSFQLTSDSPLSIKSRLAEARLAGGTLGSILHIIPLVTEQGEGGAAIQRPASLFEFLRAIGATPPENLLRAFTGEYFFGIHTVDKNAPVLVIEVSSYDRAFDGMLSWEGSINGDLAPIFTAVPRLKTGTDGIPTERLFADIVMRNYDVRALNDDSDSIMLYYSFPTRDLLVIAESPYTFTEILSRLQAGRRL